MEYIKANLPSSEQDYENGNGEGVFMLVDAVAKMAYDTDEAGTTYTGILDNDSWNYPGLGHGEELPIEMRGDCRPVVPYEYLVDHYGLPEIN